MSLIPTYCVFFFFSIFVYHIRELTKCSSDFSCIKYFRLVCFLNEYEIIYVMYNLEVYLTERFLRKHQVVNFKAAGNALHTQGLPIKYTNNVN